jgi:enamine deaminase RidA (YjgF/YER057c/UK114 family)
MANQDRQDSGRGVTDTPRTTSAMIERHGTTPRYSNLVAHGDTVYLVEVPASLDADITVQTQELLDSVEYQLAYAGSDKSRLLLVTVYLREMADYDPMNAVWDAWLPPGAAPARACVEARLAHAGYRVEMAVIAAR